MDDLQCVMSKKEVDLMVHHYRCEALRWDGDVGSEHLVEAALDMLDYWLEQQRRFG